MRFIHQRDAKLEASALLFVQAVFAAFVKGLRTGDIDNSIAGEIELAVFECFERLEAHRISTRHIQSFVECIMALAASGIGSRRQVEDYYAVIDTAVASLAKEEPN